MLTLAPGSTTWMLQQLGKPKINCKPGSSDKVNNPASCVALRPMEPNSQYRARCKNPLPPWQRDVTVKLVVAGIVTTPEVENAL